jgi:C2 domain
VGEETVLEVDLLPSAALHSSASGKLAEKPEVPVGRLSLHCTVRDNSDVVDAIVVQKAPAERVIDPSAPIQGQGQGQGQEEDFVQEGFVKGMLFISSAHGIKLPNKELIGKGDPFITFRLGPWEARSKTLQNAGGDTIWNDLDISTPVTADDLRKYVLTVTVYDENTHRDNAVIGTGEVFLKRTGSKIGVEVEVNVPLSDKNGRSAGRIVIMTQVGRLYDVCPSVFVNSCCPSVRSTFIVVHLSFLYAHIHVCVTVPPLCDFLSIKVL